MRRLGWFGSMTGVLWLVMLAIPVSAQTLSVRPRPPASEAFSAPGTSTGAPGAGTWAPGAVSGAPGESECDRLAALHLPYTSITEVHARAAPDWTRALSACQSEVQAHPDDMHLVYQLARAEDHMRDYMPALRHYRNVAEAGYAEAMVDLGALYYYGHGVVQNDAAAFQWMSKAADAGSVRALANLAAMYGDGRGVAKDDARSLDLAERAIEQGNPFGLKIVADHYFNGAGVTRDYRMCAQYLQQAADLGDGRSMKFLANLYEGGYLGAPDPAKAAALRARAEEVDPASPDPSPARLPPLRQAGAPHPQSPMPMPGRRYVTYRYNPAWQAAPGDTRCCPNNMLVCPLGRHFCGH